MLKKCCSICGKVFESEVRNKKYCSEECGKIGKKKRYRNRYLAHCDEILERQRDRKFDKLCEKLFGRRLT